MAETRTSSATLHTDEDAFLLDAVMGLKLSQLRDFLAQFQLPRSGTKQEIRQRIMEAIENDTITRDDLVQLLDAITPWGKQHVILYNGPADIPAEWRSETAARAHLRRHHVDDLFNARIPLVLPQELEISSIDHSRDLLRVFAVERRDYTDRVPDMDHTEVEAGEVIEYRAHRHGIERGLVIFEWNLTANTATLQMTELPSGSDYDAVVNRFVELVRSWLDLSRFQRLDIKNSIKRLHEKEEAGTPEARSHGIAYRTVSGRRLVGISPTADASVLGERVVDDALRNVRRRGVGHQGNFYWLPAEADNGNPLDAEVHIVIVADKGRINFKTDNTEAALRYVLSRVRAISV